jgi:hypothetical protein
VSGHLKKNPGIVLTYFLLHIEARISKSVILEARKLLDKTMTG